MAWEFEQESQPTQEGMAMQLRFEECMASLIEGYALEVENHCATPSTIVLRSDHSTSADPTPTR